MGYGFTLIISSESAISSPFRRHYERSYPVFTAFWRQVGASFQDCSLKRIGRSNYRMIRIPRDARTEHSEYPRVLLHLAHVATGCIGLLPVTKHCAGNRTCKKELICLSSFVPAVITDDARSATGRLPKSCGRTCRASLPSPSVDDNLESVFQIEPPSCAHLQSRAGYLRNIGLADVLHRTNGNIAPAVRICVCRSCTAIISETRNRRPGRSDIDNATQQRVGHAPVLLGVRACD